MSANHLTREALRRFLCNLSTRPERLAVVKHLLAGCDRCARLAALVFHLPAAEEALAPPLGGSASRGRGGQPRTESESHEEAAERLLGWSQWACLETLPAEERLLAVRRSPALQHRGLYRRLLEASNLTRRYRPQEGVGIARLAVQLAYLLDPGRYGQRQVARYRAEAWAELAVSHDLGDEHEACAAALKRGWGEHGRTAGDPMSRLRLLQVEASLAAHRRGWRTAEELLNEALEICRAADNPHREGITLLYLSELMSVRDPARAIPVAEKALALIDTRAERIQIIARHSLVYMMVYTCKPDAVVCALDGMRPLYSKFNDPYIQLRRRWLEGKILRGFGNFTAAIETFNEVADGFRSLNLNHALDNVSIDLAWTHEKQARGDPGPLPLT
jgi:hypothetical protein